MDQRTFVKLRLKDSLKKFLPQTVINYLRKIQNFLYANRKFDYNKAQHYELEGQIYFLETNREIFSNYFEVFEESRKNNRFDDHGLIDFFGSEEKWRKFCLDIRDSEKICLEIGSGPMGIIARWYWVKNKILIEPLLNEYKETSLKLFGKTFLTDDIKLYSQKAEIFIKDLDNKIDGCIVSTNALDHAEDPLKILQNISKYAKKGCRFIFWSTLYYPHGYNEGHRNIVKTKEEFERILEDLGFIIETVVPRECLPNDGNLIYGCIAVKV